MRILLIALLLLGSCDYVSAWRDKQVTTMHRNAKGSTVTPPAIPPKLAEDIAADVPVDKSWTIYQYMEGSGNVQVGALSTWKPEQTCEWLNGRMTEMGYSTEDNLSRLLEGATYTGKGKYATLVLKVDANAAGQCSVEISGKE